MSAVPAAAAPSGQILLVEDNMEQARLLRRWLEADTGLRVVHTRTGHGALFHLARADLWDAIVSDIHLPGCDGIEVLRHARRRQPRTPILLLTARPELDRAVEALRLRADDLLTKPVQRPALAEKMRSLLADPRRALTSVLAIGAHPDDVEIGCGGILLDHAVRGDRVTILTLTCGENGGAPERRRRESERAAGLIGARLLLHDLPDGRLTEGHETIGPIEDAIRACEPGIVYTHTAHDAHQDHRAVHRATMVAARRVPNVFCYQAPSTSIDFRPSRFVDVGREVDRKIAVLEAYESQFHKRSYLSPDLIRATLAYWGRFADYALVEPLEVVRSTQ